MIPKKIDYKYIIHIKKILWLQNEITNSRMICVSDIKVMNERWDIYLKNVIIYVCNQGCELKVNIFEERDIDTN